METKRVILKDSNEKEVGDSIQLAEETIKSILKHLEQINKKVAKLDPQTRYFVTDALLANILEGAKLPPYTLTSILGKFIMLSQFPYMVTKQDKKVGNLSYVS